jgi:hypothetical protein
MLFLLRVNKNVLICKIVLLDTVHFLSYKIMDLTVLPHFILMW